MIWESTSLMTAIDLVIIAIMGAALWSFVQTRGYRSLLAHIGPLLIISGLLFIALFYLIDLATMHALPLYMPMAEAMVIMDSLHKNYSWLFILFAVSLIGVGLQIDFSERKQAEKAMRKGESRLRGAIESLQEGFVLFDMDDRIVMVNDVYRRINPKAEEYLEKGMRFEDCIRANLAEGKMMEGLGREEDFIRERMEQHRNPGPPILRQFSDGKWYILKETRTPDGGTALTFTDITELRTTTEAKERLSQAVETVPIGIALFDSEDRLVFFNKRYEELMDVMADILKSGVTFEEMIRTMVDRAPVKDARGREEEFIQERMEHHQNPTGPFDIRRENMWLMANEIRLTDGGIFTIITDITDRRQAEEALKESQARLANILDNYPAPIYFKDTEGRFLVANKQYQKMYDVKLEDIKGKTSKEIFRDDLGKMFSAHDQEVLNTRKAIEREESISGRTYLTLKFPIVDPTGELLGLGGVETDITEQKKAEDALHESQAELLEAQRIARLGNWSRDLKTDRVTWSDETFRIYGYEPGKFEPTYDHYLKVIHPDDKKKIETLIGKATSQRKPTSLEYRIVRPDGEVRWVFVRAVATVDDEGNPVSLTGTVQDITEQKEAEEALRDSEARFKDIAEAASDWFWEMDENLRSTYHSPRYYEITGFRPEDKIGTTRTRYVDASELDRDADNWAAHMKDLEARRPFKNFEFAFKAKDGTTISARINGTPVFDAGGAFQGYRGTGSDITEKKKAEQALQERERRFHAVTDTAPNAIINIDQGGKVILWNKAAEETFGYAEPEILGKPLAKIMPKRFRKRHREGIKRLNKTGVSDLLGDTTELVGLRKDGGEFPIELSLSMWKTEEKVNYVGILRDITERKTAEEALRRSEERLSGAIMSLQEGFVLFDADDRLVMMNDVYRRMEPAAKEFLKLGMSFEDSIRAYVERGLIVEAIGREEEFIRERMEQHRNPKGPIIRQFTNGAWYIIEETLTPEGGAAMTFTDITGLKQFEAALNESQQRFKDIAESMSDWFWEMGPDLRFTDFSDRYAEITHFDPKKRLGNQRIDFVPESELKANAEKWAAHLADLEARRPFRNFEYASTATTEGIRHVRISGKPVFDDEGNFLGYRGTGADITEQKKAEEALRKSEALFRAVVDHSPTKIHIKDVDGRYMLLNKEAEKLFGVTDEESRGKTSYDLFPKEVADAFLEHDRAVLFSGKAIEEEEEFTLDDGVHTYLTVKFPINDLGGVSAVGAIGTDITKLKQAEEARRESDVTVRAIITTAQDGIITIDDKGIIDTFNPAAERIFGYSADEVVGRNVNILMSEPERSEHDTYLNNYLETGDAKIIGIGREVTGRRKNGAEFPMELNISQMNIADRTMFTGMVRDITELKQAEEALHKLSQAVQQSPASVVITDTEGVIEYVNEKFTEMNGYSAEEAIGQNPRILKSGETLDAVYERLWADITAGKEWRGTLSNKRKDGTVYLAGVSISPIVAPDGAVTHFIGAMQDITQRVEDERRLKQTEKMESLGGLAGGIAHDFNNMLLPILSLTDMTRKSLPEDSRERLRLEKVVEAAMRAKNLVARILAFSRREDAVRENIDIHAVIHEAMGLLRSTVLTTIKIKQRLKRDTGTVFADRAQMASVLLNLASNATDAMGGKTGEMTVSLAPVKVGRKKAASIQGLGEGKYAMLAVKDTGCGMDEETLARIMDPFFTTKPVGEGTGLGLSMVHGIVSKHGGAVHIITAPGEGTTVEVYLPLVDGEAVH